MSAFSFCVITFPGLSDNVLFSNPLIIVLGFPGGLVVKNLPANARDTGVGALISGWEDALEEVMATPSSISCLKNSLDRGAWQAIDHGVTRRQTWSRHD